ncbi:hypothetical protein QN277_018772 [Acacia crassicarpa]|uniref:Uncharacterized protein n=1 Tax=Acacia crassicarpa TaxID=499986 RepID=A0AAE1MUX2_9FABA|nr:hypothetical protein QN277_018772 [Acacia crassicarpa]
MRLIGVASCLSFLLLLLLLLFLLKTSPASAKFQSFKSGPIPFQAKPSFANKKTHKGEDHGSEVAPAFGDEKRKIYTGPNPLHNR